MTPLPGRWSRPRRFFDAHAVEEPWHVERFVRSWEWLRPRVTRRIRLLECGGEGPFTDWLRSRRIPVESTDPHDLREPLPFPSGRYDVLLLMEVIEHLKDRESSDPATFCGSGITMCLRELHRLARPGGCLFLTTPNLAGFHTIMRVLGGHHPFQYPLHPRELAPEDVLRYLSECGWEVRECVALDVWGGLGVTPVQKEAILRLSAEVQGSSQWLEGDCLFVIAEKPLDRRAS